MDELHLRYKKETTFTLTGDSGNYTLTAPLTGSYTFSIQADFSKGPFIIEEIIPQVMVRTTDDEKVLFLNNIECVLYPRPVASAASDFQSAFTLSTNDEAIPNLAQNDKAYLDINNNQLNIRPFGLRAINGGFYIELTMYEGQLYNSIIVLNDVINYNFFFTCKIRY